MKINREELLKVLIAVRPGIAKREIIQQATHVIFTGDAVATFNDQICIVYPLQTDLHCSVQGEEFYKALESINETEVEIIAGEKEIKIISKKTKAGLSTLVGEKEKVESLIEDLRKRTDVKKFWKKLPKDFVQGVFLCTFTASKDMTTGVRCCVAIKDNEIYSTDNLRVSRYKLASSVEEMLIPARDAAELTKYEVTRYGKTEGWIHFITEDGVMFNCKTMVGDYPYVSLSRFFIEPTNEMVLPKELSEAMKAAAVFAAGDVDVTKMVEMKIKGSTLNCRSEKERGWMEKEIDLKKSIKGEVYFYINPIFLAQILDKATSFFLVQGGEFPDKCIFFNENFCHVIALPA